MTLEEFRARLVRVGECLEWSMARQPGGYGAVTIERRVWLTHRLSWLLHKGEDPGDLDVLHHCDNPSCCNPDHLFLGYHRDNMADKARKGRTNRAKITAQLAASIRERVAAGASQSDLAVELGIGRHTIVDIVRGRSWKWLDGPPLERKRRYRTKITEDIVRSIRAQAAAGVTRAQLAAAHGLDVSMVRNIILRLQWKHVE